MMKKSIGPQMKLLLCLKRERLKIVVESGEISGANNNLDRSSNSPENSGPGIV